MREEQVTISLINYLEITGWEIICFDFPQSGTGVSLHINADLRSGKNKGVIIPDIIAHKDNRIVFFENKDRYVFEDFMKLSRIKNEQQYSDALGRLLSRFINYSIYFGVGMPNSARNIKRTLENKQYIDFALFVENDKSTIVGFEIDSIFY